MPFLRKTNAPSDHDRFGASGEIAVNFKSAFKPIVISAALVTLTATAALAGMPAGVTISKDHRETSVRHRDFAYRPVLLPPKGLTTIAGNIGTYYAKAAYYPFSGETISGPD